MYWSGKMKHTITIIVIIFLLLEKDYIKSKIQFKFILINIVRKEFSQFILDTMNITITFMAILKEVSSFILVTTKAYLLS